jgi:hypothetical protein
MAASSSITPVKGQWALPPLILHPFSSEDTAERLLEGSKASLMLHGLIPSLGRDLESLADTVLRSRVQEVRMLYFLGKDVLRWVEQCVDFVGRTSELQNCGLRGQSFASLLVDRPPDSISHKLQVWGVTDQKSVFSRAIGITAVFRDPPTIDTVSSLFLKNYHRFLDYLYVCHQNLEPYTEIHSRNFSVQMYASAEYSQMLSEQWEKEI